MLVCKASILSVALSAALLSGCGDKPASGAGAAQASALTFTAGQATNAFGLVAALTAERTPRDATGGFGVVFSDRALEFLRADDPETVDAIAPQMESWRNITVNLRGQSVEIDGVAIRDRQEDLSAFLARNGNPYSRIGADEISAVQLA